MRYPNIDLKQTGMRLETKIKGAGYNVKYVQEYLHLSCPQPIYRWFKGQILPSLDHMYALSMLLDVHMDELIVPKKQGGMIVLFMEQAKDSTVKRCLSYYYRLCQVA